MATREILTFPDERLRQKCAPVEKVDATIETLLDDMAETMYAAPGVGLAAPQIGVNLRVLVADVSHSSEDQPKLFEMINPVMVETSGRSTTEEGCLSFPKVYEKVTRPERIVVEARDRNWNPIRLEADGFLAVALQHELDHLDGVLFIDHMSRLKRGFIRRKMIKRKAELNGG